MDRQFIFALFVDPFGVESLLTSLEEAEISLKDASVLGRENSKVRPLLEDAGPLKGIKFADLETALERLGIPKDTALTYQKAVENGEYLVAVLAEEDIGDTIRAMMEDSSGAFLMSIAL